MSRATAVTEIKKHSPWRERLAKDWKVFSGSVLGRIGLTLLCIFGLMAVLSYVPQMIDPIYNPMTGVDPLVSASTPPSVRHWLGTDFMGRDILSQLLAGARVAFLVGVSAAFMSVVLGVSIGMISGYAGGWVDSLLMRMADMIMVMPTLLVILMLSSLFGNLSIWTIVLMIALFRWPGVSRVIRAQTLSLKQRPFIDAAKVAGALPHQDRVPPHHAQRAAACVSLHDVQGHFGHCDRSRAGLSGLRRSQHG